VERNGEIATVVRNKDGWKEDWVLDADGFEEELELKVEYDGSSITHLGYDDTRLVVRIKSHPNLPDGKACKESDQGLFTFQVEEDIVVVGIIVADGRLEESKD
jgi:hypothetical protein